MNSLFETTCEHIRKRRQLSDGSMVKYRQKISKFHELLNGDHEFGGLGFLATKRVELMNEIKKEKDASARSSYSCLLGALTHKNKTAIDPVFNIVVEELRINMELKNQQYVDMKIREPHSEALLENWVSVGALKGYQRKVMRNAHDIYKRHKDTKELTWSVFKVIQKATIATLYINYRNKNERYPSWYKALTPPEQLPSDENASHIAPKRLEYGSLKVVHGVPHGEPPSDGTNILYVSGNLPRQKRLWLCDQKNKTPHWEPINSILNKAINLQMWAVGRYTGESKTENLLILKNAKRMDKPNLSDWVKKSFEDVGVNITANSLRHIIAEETGVASEDKKLLGEQLRGMNHSNEVHNLVYST